MKNVKRILVMLLCAALLVGASVAGTLAYLTHQTGTVSNTFTVGRVNLGAAGEGLDEADVNEYGELLYKTATDGVYSTEGTELAPRVMSNEYKLLPGHEYIKDPVIHVLEKSEECYLFVRVANGIAAIESGTTIAQQMAANGWLVLDEAEGIYYLSTTAAATGAGESADYPVFGSFTIADDADVASYSAATISVTAYAVQADGFDNAAEAWAAGFGA